MERQSGLSELSVISWVSAIQGCPLSGVPLYLYREMWFVDVYIYVCYNKINIVYCIIAELKILLLT